jgi:hypothetical protein
MRNETRQTRDCAGRGVSLDKRYLDLFWLPRNGHDDLAGVGASLCAVAAQSQCLRNLNERCPIAGGVLYNLQTLLSSNESLTWSPACCLAPSVSLAIS